MSTDTLGTLAEAWPDLYRTHRGRAIPLTLPASQWQAAKDLADTYPADRLLAMAALFLATPFWDPKYPRTLNALRTVAPALDEWLDTRPGEPFRAPERPIRRSDVPMDHWEWDCHHTPSCGSQGGCTRLQAMESARG